MGVFVQPTPQELMAQTFRQRGDWCQVFSLERLALPISQLSGLILTIWLRFPGRRSVKGKSVPKLTRKGEVTSDTPIFRGEYEFLPQKPRVGRVFKSPKHVKLGVCKAKLQEEPSRVMWQSSAPKKVAKARMQPDWPAITTRFRGGESVGWPC